MRRHDRTSVIVIEVDKEMRVPGYESWWDVPISEVSEIESIRQARAQYEQGSEEGAASRNGRRLGGDRDDLPSMKFGTMSAANGAARRPTAVPRF